MFSITVLVSFELKPKEIQARNKCVEAIILDDCSFLLEIHVSGGHPISFCVALNEVTK